jgi:hypothetical protein
MSGGLIAPIRWVAILSSTDRTLSTSPAKGALNVEYMQARGYTIVGDTPVIRQNSG